MTSQVRGSANASSAVDQLTRDAQGQIMYNQYFYGLAATNANGIKVEAGVDHWSLYDDQAVGMATNTAGDGLFSTSGNMYDGIQACAAGRAHAQGFTHGGETNASGASLFSA